MTAFSPVFAGSVTLAAASTLRYAMEDLAKVFEQSTGHRLKVAYGSSGNFYSQIRQGAPFDVFMAADMDYPMRVLNEGLGAAPVLKYAEGRLVVLVSKKSKVLADSDLNDVKAGLADGRLKKLAIANPALAPYGMRAQETLQRAGIWEAVKPKLVMGENISQTTQFAASGAADAGLVALSLAISPQLTASTRYALVDKAWHQPLLHGMVLINRENPAAADLFAFMQTPAAKAILKKYGYD